MSDSFAALWTVALQAPLSMAFPRQYFWSRLPFPLPGYLPPGIEPTSPVSPALQVDTYLWTMAMVAIKMHVDMVAFQSQSCNLHCKWAHVHLQIRTFCEKCNKMSDILLEDLPCTVESEEACKPLLPASCTPVKAPPWLGFRWIKPEAKLINGKPILFRVVSFN